MISQPENTTQSTVAALKVLQIGMGWFPEQAGGLNRIFYGCHENLPSYNVELTGLVAGSNLANLEACEQIYSFATGESSLLKRWIAARNSARHLLAEKKPNIVAAHFALYTLPVLPLIQDIPLVVHFHGPWALEGNTEGNQSLKTWLKKQVELPTYRRADRFIVLSEAFRQVLHREYAVPLEKINIVPGGIDCDRFALALDQKAARARLAWPQDRPILFVVRRLAKRMGLENLIAAMVEVRRHYPETLLMIAGKGSLQTELQNQIEDLNLHESVKLLGFLPDEDLPLAYRAANLSIVPTVALEGFGLIIIESLATGTPVMGTPVGGIPEILEPLSADLLFSGTATEDLSQGIIEALRGERSLPSADTCRAYAEANYSWPIIAQKIKAVYEQTIANSLK